MNTSCAPSEVVSLLLVPHHDQSAPLRVVRIPAAVFCSAGWKRVFVCVCARDQRGRWEADDDQVVIKVLKENIDNRRGRSSQCSASCCVYELQQHQFPLWACKPCQSLLFKCACWCPGCVCVLFYALYTIFFFKYYYILHGNCNMITTNQLIHIFFIIVYFNLSFSFVTYITLSMLHVYEK